MVTHVNLKQKLPMKEIGLFIVIIILAMTSCSPCDDGEADETPTDNGNTRQEAIYREVASKSNAT